MAERRMFSKTIIDSDAFLDMLPQAQALYFHLVMNANNKGNLYNVKSVCRGVRGVKYLNNVIENGFIIDYGNNVFKVSDWDNHNSSIELKKKRLNYSYRKWRFSVLKRDNFKCKKCGETNNLEAHHINPFCSHEDLRENIDNGITLCYSCHKKIHKEIKEL